MSTSILNRALILTGCILPCVFAANTPAAIQFEEITTGSGLEYTGASFGASWGYFNNDNWPDLWVGNHAMPPDLFVNNKDGSFTAIELDLAVPKADMHGASWADFDNDGDQDLFIETGAKFGTGAGANQLLVNTDGQLEDKAMLYGLDYPLGRGRTPLWLDWNSDGNLDLLISNERRIDNLAPTILFSQTGNGFIDSFPTTGFTSDSGSEFSQLLYLNNSGPAIIIDANPFPNRVYGVQSTPFVDLDSISTLFPGKLYNIQDSAIADFNGDLLSDVFVSASRFFSGVLLENGLVSARIIANSDEKGFSVLASDETLQLSVDSTSSIIPSDVFIGSGGNHPSSLDFNLSTQNPDVIGIASHTPGVSRGVYIGYDAAEDLWTFFVSSQSWYRVDFTVSASGGVSAASSVNFDSTDAELQDHLFLQAAGGGFNDLTTTVGLKPTQCESVAAADFDNDMDIDLYMVCQKPLVNNANLLFENTGNAVFQKVEGAGGAEGSMLGRGGSVATADYDNDGFIDLFITNSFDSGATQYGPSQIFRNLGNNNHWLEIDLQGSVSNRDGIGARILLTAGGVTQLREQNNGMHRYSQNHQRLHFGLGTNTLVEKIEVEWPRGIKQVLRNLAVDRIIRVFEQNIDNDAPIINGSPDTTLQQNAIYSFTPTFFDPDNDTPLFSIINKPEWAEFDSSTGQLSGVPGNADVGSITGILITVDDQQGQPNSLATLPTFNLDVTNINDTPVITTPIGPNSVTQGTRFGPLNAADYFSDPDGDALLFSIDELPAGSGISISPDGIISGTPNENDAAASPLNVSVTATDPSTASSTQTFTLLVLSDSNGDGISDEQALILGLDPDDPDADTDNDGVSDAIEIGGNPDAPLDLDGDGRIDALEPGISANDASLVDLLPLPGGDTVNISTAANQSLSSIVTSELTDPPAGIVFPFGMLSYTTSSPVGGSVTIRLTFSAELPANLVIYKIDNNGAFTQLQEGVWQKSGVRAVDITLTDGDPLTDLDGTVNGSIDDPIALGDAGSLTSVSTASGGGCALANRGDKDPVFPFIILGAVILLFHRHKTARTPASPWT